VLLLLGAEEADCSKSFRNIARVVVLPATDAGVADVVGARTLLVSEAALEELARIAAEPERAPAQEAA
jgi:large subunit ribosomal protein L4